MELDPTFPPGQAPPGWEQYRQGFDGLFQPRPWLLFVVSGVVLAWTLWQWRRYVHGKPTPTWVVWLGVPTLAVGCVALHKELGWPLIDAFIAAGGGLYALIGVAILRSIFVPSRAGA